MAMKDIGDPATGFAQRVEAMTLARAQAGDMQAFAALYACFGRPCFNLALRILGNRALAEDLVQEVFLKMFGAIRGYRGEAPFGSWLKRMTVNAIIDQLRAQRRESDADAAEIADTQPAPDGDGAAATLDAWTLLQRLPARARAVLVLHEFEGYTHTELADLFGQSESYSKSILARAMKRLSDLVAATQETMPCQNRN
jgi:RNA polymerase sigma-70 factor (ECF subfamily)